MVRIHNSLGTVDYTKEVGRWFILHNFTRDTMDRYTIQSRHRAFNQSGGAVSLLLNQMHS